MNEIVKQMVDELDRETREKGTGATLQLFGSMDSPYLKAIFNRAVSLGLMVRHCAEAPGIYSHGPVVVDRETVRPIPFIHPADYDLDRLWNDGASCTSLAVREIIRRAAPPLSHVCIIGRGPSVKGLAEGLLKDDATVTVCHSKTKDMIGATFHSQVIVNSAPASRMLWGVTPVPGGMILDISGGMGRWKNSNLLTYIGPGDIGKLNVSILLNRFVNV